MIQSCWTAVGSRCSEIGGSAKLSTVVVDGDEQHRQHEHRQRRPPAPADSLGRASRLSSGGCESGRHDARFVVQFLLYRPAGTVSTRRSLRWPAAHAARDSVLDAFEDILDRGRRARAATLDAAARARRVSKGGLLYHFASKDALESALIERLAASSDADIATIGPRPQEPVAYFVRTSVSSQTTRSTAPSSPPRGSPRTAHPARDRGAPGDAGESWEARRCGRTRGMPRPRPRDAASSDGMYFNNALGGDIPLTHRPDMGRPLDAVVASSRRSQRRTRGLRVSRSSVDRRSR